MQIKVVAHISDVPQAAWDALVPHNNPFLQHAFLASLESSGSVGSPQTGWVPQHLLAYADGVLVGALPLYEKYDSYGEYIFDWSWAHAAQHAGLAYYPKWVAAIPFTPVTGQRLLSHPQLATPVRQAVETALVTATKELAVRCNASSVHVLFSDRAQMQAWTSQGFVSRLSLQYHWRRQPNWHTFDDFLGCLRAPSRKQVRRERRLAQASGLRFSMQPLHELNDADWQAMYLFYRHTVDEKGAFAYLTAAFFANLRAHMASEVYVAMAHDGPTPVAGALFLTRGSHLYGRYWGCLAQYDALHFELCYYMPIAWSLAHGITCFEAGAQGEHKLKRGLLPAACHSAHWLRHAGLAAAVADFVVAETQAVQAHMEEQAQHTPFHRPHNHPAPP